MNQENFQRTQQHTSIEEMIEEILSISYPNLFSIIEDIIQLSRQNEIELTDEVLNSYIIWMQNAMDDIYRKEKIILFPRLKQLAETTEKKYNSFPSFHWLYQAHTDLLLHFQRTKSQLLRQRLHSELNDIYRLLMKKIQAAETVFLQIKLIVEENLIQKIESEYYK